MAKSKNLSLEDFQFDKSLDFESPDFDIKLPKDHRKPIHKVLAGVRKGAKDQLLSGSTIRTLVKNALPKGYGSILDLADQSNRELKSLYDTASRELKPALNDIKRTTGKLLPGTDGVLPKKLQEQLKKFADSADKDSSGTGFDQREAGIGAALGEVFKGQAIMQDAQSKRQDIKDEIREGIAQLRHKDTLSELATIRSGILQLVNYQDKINVSYQRKSLELQYRSYFLAIDAFNESKRANAQTKAQLEAIVRNTSLPDAVKINTTEAAKQLLRNKFISTMGNRLMNSRTGGTLSGMFAHLHEGMVGRLRGISSGVSTALGLGDMLDMGGDMIDSHHMAGEMLGAGLTHGATAWLGKKYRPHLEKKFPWLKKGGNRAENHIQNLPRLIVDSIRRGKTVKLPGTKKDILDIPFLGEWIKESILKGAGIGDTRVEADNIRNIHEAATFTRMTNKSINEVIPGYLARILREIKVLRTGNDKIGLEQYNLSNGKFESAKKIDASIRDSILDRKKIHYTKEELERQINLRDPQRKLTKKQREALGKEISSKSGNQFTRDEVDRLIDQVDPDKKLTPEQRHLLGLQILKDSASMQTASWSRYMRKSAFTGESAKHASTFQRLFRDAKRNDKDYAQQLAFTERFNTAGDQIHDPRAIIQQYVSMGRGPELERMGIIKDGNIDINKFYELYYSDGIEPVPGATGLSRRRGRRRAGSGFGFTASGAPALTHPVAAFVPTATTLGIAATHTPTLETPHSLLESPSHLARRGERLARTQSEHARRVMTPHIDRLSVRAKQKLAQLGITKENIDKLRSYLGGNIEHLKNVDIQADVLDKIGIDKTTLDKVKKLDKSILDDLGLNQSNLNKVASMASTHWDNASDAGSVFVDKAKQRGLSIGSWLTSFGNSKVPNSKMSQSGLLHAIAEHTAQIRDVLAHGIPTIAMSGEQAAHMAKLPWYQRTIGSMFKALGTGTWNTARAGASSLRWGARQLGSGITSGVKGLGHVVNFGGRLTGLGVGGTLNYIQGFRDVYSEESGDEILLRAQKLKAGHYTDVNTKKTVRSWKDITGPVVDENGNEVLSESQAKTAYVKTPAGVKALKTLGSTIHKTVRGVNKAITEGIFGAFGVARLAGQGIALAHRLAKNFMHGPQDVYVRDKDNPERLRKALSAKTMGAGGYKNAVDKSLIHNPGDIKGEVYNYKGITVIDQEEFDMGLFDRNGNHLKSGLARLLNGPAKVAGMAWKGVKFLASGVNKGISNAFGFAKGALDVLFGKTGIFYGGGKHLMSTVEQIRDILDARLPKPHRIRKNSIEDLHNQEEKKKHELLNSIAGKPKDTSSKNGILARLKGLASLLGRKKKEGEDSSHGGLLDDAADGAQIAETFMGGKGRLLSKLGKFGGKALRFGGKALGLAGAAYGAYSAYDNAKQGNYGSAALDAGLATASGIGTFGGLGALGTTLGAVGSGLATGVAAIVGSPVLLGAAVAAGIGGAGYFGYKYFTRDKLNPLSKVRYVQYGFNPEKTDNVHKVFGLEQDLKDGVVFINGRADLDPKKGNFQKAFENFGINLKDKKAVNQFIYWFAQRFKPVYLTNMVALRNVKAGLSLSDVDSKLDDKQKKAFLDQAKWLNSPAYKVMYTPFLGQDVITSTAMDVQAAVDEAYKSFGENKDKDKGGEKSTMRNMLDQAKKKAAELWKNTKEKASDAWQAIKNKAGAVTDKVKDYGKTAFAAAGAGIGAAGSALAKVGSGISNTAKSAFDGASNLLSKGYDAAKTAIGAGAGIVTTSAGKAYQVIKGNAKVIVQKLLKAMDAAGITDLKERAMLLAQTATESGGFKSLSENLHYRASTLWSLFRRHFTSPEDAAKVAQAGPEAIANRVYGGRMGNKDPDDGFKYRGRGIIQLTGKSNYEHYGKLLGLDLVNKPDLAADPDIAAKIAIAFWKNQGHGQLEKAGQEGNVLAATRLINGGTNGLAQRQANYTKYLSMLQDGQLKSDSSTADKTKPATTDTAGAGATTPSSDSIKGGSPAIPVANQSPGITAPVVPVSAPASDDLRSKSVNSVSDFGGSSSPSSTLSLQTQSLNAQANAQKQAQSQSLGDVSGVLQKQLQIQTEQRDLLKQMVQLISQNSGSGKGNNSTETFNGKNILKRTPRDMQKPPVSMDKVNLQV